ncbi:MAG TPA: FKBP-type peptidyl-prolyl cis-trans isomerase [Rhodanobacter sp.]
MRSSLFCLVVMLVATVSAPGAIAADGLTQLAVIDRQVGTGAVARPGMDVELNYTGWLYDDSAKDHHGKKIDSSYDHGKTIVFTLGERQVIAGWDKGVKGMRVGGKRTLLIPPHLGYGARAVGDLVPPHSSLIFDIELVGAH